MIKPKNLKETSRDEQKKFFDSFDTILLDMDGVIWQWYSPICGSVDCINDLKKLGRTVHYVTNNTISTKETIFGHLEKNNFNAKLTDIVTPTLVLIDYLKKREVKDDIFIVGHDAIKGELRKNGFSLVPDPPVEVEETLTSLFANYDEERKVGAVIMDIDFNTTYLKLQKAFWYIRNNPECLFLVMIRDKSAPVGSKGPIIGPYHFVELLKEMTNRQYIEIGKPSKFMVNYIEDYFNLTDPNRVLFIGDSIQSDLSIATAGGFQKLLVLSGTDTIEDINNWQYPEEFKPAYYAENLGVLDDIIKNIYGPKL